MTATSAPGVAADAAGPRAARWALARVEGRRLLLHPIFVLGVVYFIFVAIVFGRQDARTAVIALGGGFAWITIATTFLAAFLATSREQRDGAQDTYSAQPATPRLRTEAALLSIGFAGLAGAALVALAVVALEGLDGQIIVRDQLPEVRLLELAHAPLYLMVGGTLGVLIGSWTQRLPVAALSAIMLFAPPALLSRSLATVDTAGGLFGLVVPDAAGAPRLIALVALIALAAAGALARHDRRPRVGALALAGLGALAGGLAAVLAPIAILMILLWPKSSDDPREAGEIAC